MHNKHPKYLDLRHIKLPVTGMVSILHRVSGLFLFLAMPFLLTGLSRSLESEEAFNFLIFGEKSFLFGIFVLICLWFFLHHLLAGIRFLALDFHFGTTLSTARKTSWLVLFGGIALAILMGVMLW